MAHIFTNNTLLHSLTYSPLLPRELNPFLFICLLLSEFLVYSITNMIGLYLCLFSSFSVVFFTYMDNFSFFLLFYLSLFFLDIVYTPTKKYSLIPFYEYICISFISLTKAFHCLLFLSSFSYSLTVLNYTFIHLPFIGFSTQVILSLFIVFVI